MFRKNGLLVLFLTIGPLLLWSQTNISGVINDYAQVQAIEEGCQTILTLDNANAFQATDKVLLLQMQGAEIAESDNASFGEISDPASTGSYETNEIDAIDGNQVYLKYQLINSYQLTGQLQLVRIPVLDNAIVTDTLKVAPWDGQKGGVLALEVTGLLELNAPIIANGAGFRGAIAQLNLPNDCNWFFQNNDYFYNQNSWRAAKKGEGIAALIGGKEAGRGPQANGGGGGNDHNAGGGGGANRSRGGQGGTNEEPTTFGCKGRFPGVGGRALSDFGEQRIFLGGGGGAGHGNNADQTDGGNGGGIILLIAGELRSNAFAIQADGRAAPVANGDGGGGGGAGGSVILDIGQLLDPAQITALGGLGARTINPSNRCMGPGGGGSGGHLLLDVGNEALLTVDLSGGAPGLSVNSSVCAEGTNGASSGEMGLQEDLLGIPQGPLNDGGL
ncbi:MAG: hypothetical protein AAFP19_16960, partial [Bacteroidota bacterium]